MDAKKILKDEKLEAVCGGMVDLDFQGIKYGCQKPYDEQIDGLFKNIYENEDGIVKTQIGVNGGL